MQLVCLRQQSKFIFRIFYRKSSTITNEWLNIFRLKKSGDQSGNLRLRVTSHAFNIILHDALFKFFESVVPETFQNPFDPVVSLGLGLTLKRHLACGLKKFLELLNRFDLGIIHGDCHLPILIPANPFSITLYFMLILYWKRLPLGCADIHLSCESNPACCAPPPPIHECGGCESDGTCCTPWTPSASGSCRGDEGCPIGLVAVTRQCGGNVGQQTSCQPSSTCVFQCTGNLPDHSKACPDAEVGLRRDKDWELVPNCVPTVKCLAVCDPCFHINQAGNACDADPCCDNQICDITEDCSCADCVAQPPLECMCQDAGIFDINPPCGQGFSQCASNAALTGLRFRNALITNQCLDMWSLTSCCKAPAQLTNCQTTEWIDNPSFGQYVNSSCPGGKVLTGINFRNSCQGNQRLDMWQLVCCEIAGRPTPTSCYTTTEFDIDLKGGEVQSNCDSGYFVQGVNFKNSPSTNQCVDMWELKCCRYD